MSQRPPLHIPGVGDVKIEQVQPSADAQLLLQAIGQLTRLIDIDLQVKLRLARGWKVEDVITDMQLTVPPAPQEPTPLLNRQQRRAQERNADHG